MESYAQKAFIYCRKSSESEDRQIQSIDDQKKALFELASRINIEVIQIFEESKSAKSPGRVVFNEMIGAVKAGTANTILAWLPDRLSRNAVDAGILVHLMDSGGLQAIITPLQTFKNTPNDKFLLQILCAQAKLENDNKRESVLRGMQSKAELGWYPHRALNGYLNTPQYQKGLKVIEKDPIRFPLVRKMWDMLLSGNYTPTQIHQMANDKWGYRTVRDKKLSRSAVYDIFQNSFYYGYFNYRGQMMQGKHEPMITKDEFDRAQKILKRKDVARPSKHEFLFSNLLKCRICGFSICGTKKHKAYKRTGKIKDYIYYRCSHMNKKTACRESPVTEANLFNQFLDLFGSIEIEKEFLEWATIYYKEVYEYEKQQEQYITKSQQSAVIGAKERLSELLEMRLNKEISPEEYRKKKLEITSEVGKLEWQKTAEAPQWYENSTRALSVAFLAQKKFREGTDLDRKAMIREVNSNLFLIGGFVASELKKPYFLLKQLNDTQEERKTTFEPVKESFLTRKTLAFARANPRWYP